MSPFCYSKSQKGPIIWVAQSIRYAGVIWLFFLIAHLYLIGVWLGENQIKHGKVHGKAW